MKATKQSAGILLYRYNNNTVELFLVHPGGPFWTKKDAGAWSIPKGEFIDEDPLLAAKREFTEETGSLPDFKNITALKPVKLKSGKTVYAWAAEGNLDANAITSNFCEIEWPPKTGKIISVPEVDRAGWFTAEEALVKINHVQAALIHQLITLLAVS
ncbi:MAG TPA: NUDIX domain-containing protein [Chitinophagaceae bacterium]|nr:NUDIX domain-containing protein [Chitinophagaceae bacterium]